MLAGILMPYLSSSLDSTFRFVIRNCEFKRAEFNLVQVAISIFIGLLVVTDRVPCVILPLLTGMSTGQGSGQNFVASFPTAAPTGITSKVRASDKYKAGMALA